MAKFKIPIRVWILLFALVLAFLAINPTPYAEGIQIKSVESGVATENGLAIGQIITHINGEPIDSFSEYNEIINSLQNKEQTITLNTGKGDYEYNITNDIGFVLNENLTVTYTDVGTPVQVGDTILGINEHEFTNLSSFNNKVNEFLPKKVYKITTNKGEIAFLARSFPELRVGEAAKSNIKKGLDLEGGTRVLLKPISENTISQSEIADLIKVLSNRLNIYGLSDLKIREAKDWSGERFVLIEIAGASQEEVRDLIAQQGKFEAKIGEEIVFEGGKKDIPFVCRNDGSCSGVRSCSPTTDGYYCRFEFVIHLSPEAAQRHANITNKLGVIASENGKEILSENLDFYLDDQQVDSLNIGADLKGSETTSIAISGPGSAPNRDGAIENALNNMDKLQTVLITGSLPFDLEIVKLDSISPLLGQSFLKNSIIVGLIALLGVACVIYIRYRSIKIILPMMFTILSEIILILGFAALINWNLDVAAIAGILAAIGTGVDHQIVIIDETIKGNSSQYSNWKQKLKGAFFIIFVAYATTVAAMLPLWNAGAGLIRGFAVTTIVGVTIGVFLTRPAFAAIAERLFKE
jgi:preprotein translocase subunit SecD